jgi:hypothetical protein
LLRIYPILLNNFRFVRTTPSTNKQSISVTMSICAHKLALRLPRDIFNHERVHYQWFRSLSHLVNAEGTPVLVCKVPSVNFRFQRTPALLCQLSASRNLSVPVHTLLFHRFYATTGKDKGSSSDKKSLVEARESPYAHLTVGQKGEHSDSAVAITSSDKSHSHDAWYIFLHNITSISCA